MVSMSHILDYDMAVCVSMRQFVELNRFLYGGLQGDGRFDDDERMIFLQQAIDAVKNIMRCEMMTFSFYRWA